MSKVLEVLKRCFQNKPKAVADPVFPVGWCSNPLVGAPMSDRATFQKKCISKLDNLDSKDPPRPNNGKSMLWQ